MYARSALGAVLALATFAVAGTAQTGTPVISGDAMSCFSMSAANGGAASYKTVDSAGPGFTKAWDVQTTTAGANSWDVRMRCFSTLPVAKNDYLVASFYMRTVAPGAGQTVGMTSFVFERNASPYDKSTGSTYTAGTEWQRIDVVFQANDNYPGTSDATKYNLSFWVNYAGQEIQIGGLSILNYGPNFDPYSLNLPNYPYAGHDANAPWRRDALARIEKTRKADVAVVLRDAQGAPIVGAPVRVKMKRHAFGWGTAIVGASILNEAKYSQAVVDNFNKLVHENDLKWPDFEANPSRATNGFTFAAAHDYRMFRGHNLIWPSLTQGYLPSDVATMVRNLMATGAANDAAGVAALNKRIDDHFTAALNFTKGKVTEWDVVNEPYSNQDVVKALGQDPAAPPAMVHWFQLARTLDPSIKLYLNDYCMVACGGSDLGHINFTANLLKYLIAQGAPVDGLGIQGHFDSTLTPPTRVLELLDFWGAIVNELQITEFDINVADEQLQADYTRDFLIACFSHPKMAGFMLWGFFGGHDWVTNPLFYNSDWTERKALRVWRDLVYKQWWTDTSGVTASDGTFRTRAMLGDYDVVYSVNGVEKTVPLTVTAGKTNYVQLGAVAPPTFDAAHVVNAASGASGPVAPGELVRISGANIGTAQPQARNTALNATPTELALTQVSFDGTPATLVDAGANQALVVVPAGVQNPTSITIASMGATSTAISVPRAVASPALFTCTNASSVPLMLSATGTNSCAAGRAVAKTNQAIAFYATGLGASTTVQFNGADAPSCTSASITLLMPGVWQIVTCAPASAGATTVTLQSEGATSSGAALTVQ